jgi:hypothetical protein
MTRDDIKQMALEARLMSAMDECTWSASIPNADYPDRLGEFARLAAAAEREACAKVVEKYTGAWDDEGYALAQAIRARGTK